VIRGVDARPEAFAWRRQVMNEAFGGNTRLLFYVAPFLYTLLLAALWAPMGWLLVLVYHLQPFGVFAGQGLNIQNLHWLSLFRIPIEYRNWWVAFRTMRKGKNTRQEKADLLREEYGKWLNRSPEDFFQKPRKKCVLCRKETLSPLLDTPDLYQGKPGRFKLDECDSCGHIFQNPQLNSEGLSFYYKDFYDGLGEDMLESIFDSAGNPYEARGALVRKHGGDSPEAWLDVGAGHGHLCAYLKNRFPKTRFHALDIGDSIREALSRTWVDQIHQGFFPDLAPSLRGQFDVVSMSHYLEHTVEPKREIQSAHDALREGGVLFIELPDPESRLGRILKQYWLPWFQPQHQHLFSVSNLVEILQEEGFQVEEVQRGEAHQAVDFSSALILGLNQVVPDRSLPWFENTSKRYHGVRSAVWALGFLPLLLLKGIDLSFSPLLARPGWSNTFRLLARKSS
jgi:SAM-dependent methyltransferase